MEQDARLKVKAAHKTFYIIHTCILGSLFVIGYWPEAMLDGFLYLYLVFVAAYMAFAIMTKASAKALIVAAVIDLGMYGVGLCHKLAAI